MTTTRTRPTGERCWRAFIGQIPAELELNLDVGLALGLSNAQVLETVPFLEEMSEIEREAVCEGLDWRRWELVEEAERS